MGYLIGIDFGTTNSCIYVKENKDTPKQLDFKNRINFCSFGFVTNDRRAKIARQIEF